jgi:hypothetical protein
MDQEGSWGQLGVKITRRFDPHIADSIEEVERAVLIGDAMPAARQAFLAALLICEDDGSFKATEAIMAANWMQSLGRITWRREPQQTIVSWSEYLS